MFFIVKVQDKKAENNFSKLFSQLFSKRYITYEVRTKTFSFKVLELKSKNLVNSKKALKIIGNHRILMSDEIYNISKKPYLKINTTEYEQKLLLNGINEIFQTKRLFPSLCVLIDMQAKYFCLADVLVNSFKSVYIITGKKAQYQNFADKKLYECGAAVLIGEKFKFFDDTSFIVSPDNIFTNDIKLSMQHSMQLSKLPIIALKSIDYRQSLTIHSFRAQIPLRYEKYLPNGIDPHFFLSALYKYCCVADNSITKPTFVYVNEKCETINSMKINLYSSFGY